MNLCRKAKTTRAASQKLKQQDDIASYTLGNYVVLSQVMEIGMQDYTICVQVPVQIKTIIRSKIFGSYR